MNMKRVNEVNATIILLIFLTNPQEIVKIQNLFFKTMLYNALHVTLDDIFRHLYSTTNNFR